MEEGVNNDAHTHKHKIPPTVFFIIKARICSRPQHAYTHTNKPTKLIRVYELHSRNTHVATHATPPQQTHKSTQKHIHTKHIKNAVFTFPCFGPLPHSGSLPVDPTGRSNNNRNTTNTAHTEHKNTQYASRATHTRRSTYTRDSSDFQEDIASLQHQGEKEKKHNKTLHTQNAQHITHTRTRN